MKPCRGKLKGPIMLSSHWNPLLYNVSSGCWCWEVSVCKKLLLPYWYASHPSSVAPSNFLILFSCHTPYSHALSLCVKPSVSFPPISFHLASCFLTFNLHLSRETSVLYHLINFAAYWKPSQWLQVVHRDEKSYDFSEDLLPFFFVFAVNWDIILSPASILKSSHGNSM